jgi:hypothetical protein
VKKPYIMGKPPRPLGEFSGHGRLRDDPDRDPNGLAAAQLPQRGRSRLLPAPGEELAAALVHHVEQRSGDYCQRHQDDVGLHDGRGQEIARRGKRITGEHVAVLPLTLILWAHAPAGTRKGL